MGECRELSGHQVPFLVSLRGPGWHITPSELFSHVQLVWVHEPLPFTCSKLSRSTDLHQAMSQPPPVPGSEP